MKTSRKGLVSWATPAVLIRSANSNSNSNIFNSNINSINQQQYFFFLRFTMGSSSSKPLRMLPLPGTFESLNDDSKRLILQFVGNICYRTFGGINKHCKDIYITSGMTKETYFYGYAPLYRITNKIERAIQAIQDKCKNANLNKRKREVFKVFEPVGKGVLLCDRSDVLDWAIQKRNKDVLIVICEVVAGGGRTDVLEKVWNHIEDEDDEKRYFVFRGVIYKKEDIFEAVERSAARHGKLNVLKWLETKGISINKISCAWTATHYGQLHILQWLKEERGLELNGGFYILAAEKGQLHILKWLQEEKVFRNGHENMDLYSCAIRGHHLRGGGHLHVLKWLREQGFPWDKWTFRRAARKGNLDILQWLHNEGCPWDQNNFVLEDQVKPEVFDWLRANGYHDRIRNLSEMIDFQFNFNF